VIGVLAIVCCALPLDLVIDALVTTRIVVQFLGQVVGVMRLRRVRPELHRPYRIWLYPLPNLIALVGWCFVFATSDRAVLIFALAVIAAGLIFFLAWSRYTGRWPFGPGTEEPESPTS